MEREGCDCNVCSKNLLAAIERLEKRDEANTRILHELLAKVSQLNDLVASYVTKTKESITEIKAATAAPTTTAPTTAATAKTATTATPTTAKTVATNKTKPALDHRDAVRKNFDQANAKLK